MSFTELLNEDKKTQLNTKEVNLLLTFLNKENNYNQSEDIKEVLKKLMKGSSYAPDIYYSILHKNEL